MPSDITPSGGTKSTTTPLLIAFCPSLEVASAELRHMAQPWLKAGAAHSKNTAVRSVARILISLPTTVYGRRPEKRRSSLDRKSTRLNSSHVSISYAVFCLKKKKIKFLPISSKKKKKKIYKVL